MESFDRFSEKKLPNENNFYIILKDEHVSDTQYVYPIKVWTTFKLKNMRKHHDLYLKSEVLLLADVFKNFRKTCMQYYKLDPCDYFTSPDYLEMQC